MNNNQFFPFERNRYYAGKMLTSADFVAEQKYFLDKQRFLSTMMYGSGIVCGLTVVSLDDLSILVESGVAIDGSGREIVLESSVVKKLSAVDGFDSLSSDHATLCLKYSEQPAHTVYSALHNDTDKEYEYNRITEGYELYLVDTDELDPSIKIESEFLTRESLFTTKNFRGEVIIPATVCKGRNVRMIVRITKRSAEDVSFDYRSVLQVPGFECPDGGHEVEVEIKDLHLAKGEVYEKEFWMMALGSDATETNIILQSGSASGSEDGSNISVDGNFSLKVMMEDTTPLELVTRQIGQMSLEMQSMGDSGEFIRLAELRLVRTDSAYVIEEVKERGIKKYISVPSKELERGEYLDFFEKSVDIRTTPAVAASTTVEENIVPENRGVEYASGFLEIPIGSDAREGDICFSGEIIHGLGKGNVYVEVGYEYLSEDEALGKNARSTIYGNAHLFDQEGTVKAQTAVKVLNDKGSFVVAAQLMEDADLLVLTYRWVAMKFPTGEDVRDIKYEKNQSISAETPTFVMGPKENHYFGVVYHNMEPASISYELTEPASGEISADGIYTSPSKEGVYEIRIYCTDSPMISTYAYAIVKKKEYNEEEA